jgi:hypothetical protein
MANQGEKEESEEDDKFSRSNVSSAIMVRKCCSFRCIDSERSAHGYMYPIDFPVSF